MDCIFIHDIAVVMRCVHVFHAWVLSYIVSRGMGRGIFRNGKRKLD